MLRAQLSTKNKTEIRYMGTVPCTHVYWLNRLSKQDSSGAAAMHETAKVSFVKTYANQAAAETQQTETICCLAYITIYQAYG